MIDHKQLENVEYFNCQGSPLTNDANCGREIKSRINVATAVFSNQKAFVTSGLY